MLFSRATGEHACVEPSCPLADPRYRAPDSSWRYTGPAVPAFEGGWGNYVRGEAFAQVEGNSYESASLFLELVGREDLRHLLRCRVVATIPAQPDELVQQLERTLREKLAKAEAEAAQIEQEAAEVVASLTAPEKRRLVELIERERSGSRPQGCANMIVQHGPEAIEREILELKRLIAYYSLANEPVPLDFDSPVVALLPEPELPEPAPPAGTGG